jgi:hypothetical protein
MENKLRDILNAGVVIPASPLALDCNRKLDERRLRAIYRYYSASGVGGIAVGVHTTQFQIRDPKIGLFKPVLKIASDEMDNLDRVRDKKLIRVAGACGKTEQAINEASIAAGLGYHAVLLSLAAMKVASEDELITHCQEVSRVMPLIGFYLQPAVGGNVLPYSFWRRFTEIENVVAIKMAPFNRYQTLDVMRAVTESGRDDIALYTGNDDNIVIDLLTPYRFNCNGKVIERRITGGLLGHWSVWTSKAVSLLDECHTIIASGGKIPPEMMSRAIEVTDSNAAFFDAANGYKGCIAGLHEVLRRQGLMEGTWCLDPSETFGPGQLEEIDRVYAAYPHLNDDDFVRTNLEKWLI